MQSKLLELVLLEVRGHVEQSWHLKEVLAALVRCRQVYFRVDIDYSSELAS